jgi:DNA-binding IclR family transcriptional regulator
MRFYGTPGFTVAELQTATGATKSAAQLYIWELMQVGLVRKIAKQSKVWPFARYVLTKEMGPKAPVIRHAITAYDPNSETTLTTQITHRKEQV